MNTARVKDLARKRRKYVEKKTTAVSIALFMAGVTAFVGLGYLSILIILSINVGTREWFLILVFFLFYCGMMGWLGKVLIRSVKEARRVSYVPPVSVQVAFLPPEEILVRGSDQPIAAPEELLRAAHAGPVDPAEELLRPEPIEAILQQVGDRST